MGSIDILSDSKDGKRFDMYKDIVWVADIAEDPAKILYLKRLRNVVRKWVDTIENYAQFIVRRMDAYGIVVQLDSSITPLPMGFELRMRINVVGVKKEFLKRGIAMMRRLIEGGMDKRREFHRFAEVEVDVPELEEGADEQAGADSSTNGSG